MSKRAEEKPSQPKLRLAVLTSGGDAPGMNAAVRAVVRSALSRGVPIYTIYEGYQGMVDGGDNIRRASWESVGGILHQGGTAIGSARCKAFHTREGRRAAAKHLLEHGINALVVIGGDGSLTGANLFRQEWNELTSELAAAGEVDAKTARDLPSLRLVGLVGSIDNDMFGTDMTIGADTALHRIVDAVDNIASTAASHHRTFVVEVMGRNCGFLALAAAIDTGANWVLIPENPPDIEDWESEMCETLKAGRDEGRRHGIVLVSEGARDRYGLPITAHYVKDVIEHRLHADTRLTILGHVQRGGAPSAFDRYLATVLGYEAVQHVLDAPDAELPALIGIRQNRVIRSPLMRSVEKTRSIAEVIQRKDYELAMKMRGGSFRTSWDTQMTLYRARPRRPAEGEPVRRIAVLHAGGPAPGMNTAVRAAVRMAMNRGHEVFAVRDGFRGFLDDDIRPMAWMDVHGWGSKGGAELGVSRKVPTGSTLEVLAERITAHRIDGIICIGGLTSYQSAYEIGRAAESDPRLKIPVICVPATIDNNLPGAEHSIGVDTALNSIISNVDRIKQSAVASHRCFIVEVMGRDCGYLALMSGLATGAERVYLPEDGIGLGDLVEDVKGLVKSFRAGKRLGLVIRNENADSAYTTDFIARMFAKEGEGVFDVRTAVLGHIQQGGNPTPYDRIQAVRLTDRAVAWIIDQLDRGATNVAAVGNTRGTVSFTDLSTLPDLMHPTVRRPKDQWWDGLRHIMKVMCEPGTG